MAHPFQSDSVGALAADLAKAQAKMRNPTKNANNPHYKSRYSTLDEGINVIREPLSSCGISYTQREYLSGSTIMIETTLAHRTGEWMSSHSLVISVPCKPQELMSAMTYARRRALFAIVGIAGEDDDDGNEANKAVISSEKTVSPKESFELLQKMKDGLESCQTEDELTVWTLSNKGNKANLTMSDQALITRTYKSKLELVKGLTNG